MTERQDKTNAMRVLDGLKVAYTAHHYSPDIHSAIGVAEALGFPLEQVFKTLVVMPPSGRPLLAIVPGEHELDLKRLAEVAGQKRLRMATQREAESLTGLLVGGISALALLNKSFRVYLDASAQDFDTVLVSAGQRGINLQLRVEDLVRVTRARVAAIAKAPA